MKLSAHFSHDSHPAVLILRTAAIAFSVIGVIAFSWMLNEHQYVYTDGMGEFYTMFPLIFVRCFTASQSLEKSIHTRQNHQSEPPPLTLQNKNTQLAYSLLWSLIILLVRLLSPRALIHPAIYMTFDLIATGTILGFTAAKLDFVTVFRHEYSCLYQRGQCDARTLKRVEYFGCVIGILDS